jgi:hypothetical protein
LGNSLEDAIDLAKFANFERGTPMIDLSGHSPGILYAIGARSTGSAWIFGGYPNFSGSDKLAAIILERVSCKELSSAWLLLEPEGPVKITAEVLSSFGANLASDFQIKGTFKSAKGASGFAGDELQIIYKPVRTVDAAMAACTNARSMIRLK